MLSKANYALLWDISPFQVLSMTFCHLCEIPIHQTLGSAFMLSSRRSNSRLLLSKSYGCTN